MTMKHFETCFCNVCCGRVLRQRRGYNHVCWGSW